jgi:hypothetical protein
VDLYPHSPNKPSWRGAQLKQRDNLSLCLKSHAMRRITGMEAELHTLTSALDAGEWSVTASAALPPVPIGHEAGCAPEPVSGRGGERKSLPYLVSNPGCPTGSMPRHYTDGAYLSRLRFNIFHLYTLSSFK